MSRPVNATIVYDDRPEDWRDYVPAPENDFMRIEVGRNIRILYEQNFPLFTKQMLSGLSSQLKAYMKGQLEGNQVVLNGFDGFVATIKIMEPVEIQDQEGNTYTTAQKPLIRYKSVQGLLGRANTYGLYLPTAYLPIELLYNMQLSGNSAGVAMEFSPMLRNAQMRWKTTPQYRSLEGIFEMYPKLSNAKKVVGLGLGQMGGEQGPRSGRHNYRSLIQHALLLSIWELTKSVNKTTQVACIVQDPALSPNAVQTLRNAGVTVRDDPDGLLEVDDSTILVSLWPMIPAKQIIIDIACPIGIIWNDNPNETNHIPDFLQADPVSTRVKKVLDNKYVDLGLPCHEAFDGAYFYLRRE